MKRTPELLALLLALPACAGPTFEELHTRALLRESERLEQHGDEGWSTVRVHEAAKFAPREATTLRLDIAERLMERGSRYHARRLLDDLLRSGQLAGRPRLQRRARALERRLNELESTLGPCLTIAPPRPGFGDHDADGYTDDIDGCPDDPEDFDAFEDEDGCPDRDNDGDGILDAASYDEATKRWRNEDARRLPDGSTRDCRNEPEDVDGVEDDDGCPDDSDDADDADAPAAARARILESLARARALPPDVLARLQERRR